MVFLPVFNQSWMHFIRKSLVTVNMVKAVFSSSVPQIFSSSTKALNRGVTVAPKALTAMLFSLSLLQALAFSFSNTYLLSKVDSRLLYLVIGEGPMASSKMSHFSSLLHFHLLEETQYPPPCTVSLPLFVCLCSVQLRFLRSQDLEGDFILHWAMKALYKYIATANALIAPAILI